MLIVEMAFSETFFLNIKKIEHLLSHYQFYLVKSMVEMVVLLVTTNLFDGATSC